MRDLFSAKSFRSGGYTALVCVAVIAICVAAVLVVQALPATYTQLDVSQDKTTSLTDDSAEYLAALEKDITIYLVAEEGNEDSYLSILLDKMSAASSHISVVQKDPVLYPAFTSQYTSDSLDDNSLIVVCGDDYRVVNYSDMYTLSTSSYSYEFGGESAIMSAVSALVMEDIPVVYTLTGHGESDLPDNATSSISSANISVEELSLLTEDAVPDDASAVIVYAPTSDITTDEEDRLLSYLEAGGSLLVFTDYSEEELPNLADLLNAYGLEEVSGIVVEGNASYCLSGYAYYLLPEIEEHDVTDGLSGSNSYVIVPIAHGISAIESYRSTLTIEPLLVTSDSAYVKTAAATAETLECEDGDIEGSTWVGVAVSEEIDDDTTTRLIWYSTSLMFDSSLDSMVGGNNSTLLIQSLSWLADAEDVSTVAVASKSLGSSTLTMDSASATLLSLFVVAVVPLFFLIVGFVVWRKRRRL